MSGSEPDVFAEVRDRAHELARVLDDFSDRLRRLRQRNRQVEEEIAAFERELDRLRRRLAEEDST